MKLTRRFKLSTLAALTILASTSLFYACQSEPRIIVCYGPYMPAAYRTPVPTPQEYQARFAPYFAPGFSEKQAASLPPDYNFNNFQQFHVYDVQGLKTWGWLYVDQSGAVVLAYPNVSSGPFACGLAPVGIRSENASTRAYGYMNPAGKLIIPPLYDHAQPFDPNGRAIVTRNNLSAYIDTQGNLLTPFKYNTLYPYEHGVSKAVIHQPANAPSKVEYLDLQGHPLPNHKPAPEQEYQAPRHKLSEGLKPAYERPPGQSQALWGYQDQRGQWVIQPQFLDAFSFSEGLAVVALPCDPPSNYKPHNKEEPSTWASFGYIDKTGKIIIPPRFSSAADFKHGIARVQSNSYHQALIDNTGKELFSITHPNPRPEYDQYLKPTP
jgi:hypothetical protein